MAYRQPVKGRIIELVIDSTGLKIFGEGEWKVRKHGVDKRRVWRKLHLAVDPVTHNSKASHQLISRKGATACIPPCKSEGLWKKGSQVLVMRSKGWRTGKRSPSLASSDGNVPVQTVDGGEYHYAKIQRSGGEVMAYVSSMKNINSLSFWT